ncbi:hypothetical protein GALL_392230 [mine drainage metagenome]|uniref:Uncharacterized protein n=1 Tax=mine drainage metagenome TaxID=410659 RepID=A0A1J5QGG0_9ZZZZ
MVPSNGIARERDTHGPADGETRVDDDDAAREDGI